MHGSAPRRLVYSILILFPSFYAGELTVFISPTLNLSSKVIRGCEILTAAFGPAWQRAVLHPGAAGTAGCLQKPSSSRERCHCLCHRSPMAHTAAQRPTPLGERVRDASRNRVLEEIWRKLLSFKQTAAPAQRNYPRGPGAAPCTSRSHSLPGAARATREHISICGIVCSGKEKQWPGYWVVNYTTVTWWS